MEIIARKFTSAIGVGHSAGAAVLLQLALSHEVTPQSIIGVNSALVSINPLGQALLPFSRALFDLHPVRAAIAALLRNGTVAREILVDCDDKKQRLVYAIVSERIKQHSASAQVFAESDGRTRFVWIADVLPNEIAPYMDAQMDLGLLAMQKALGRSAA